MGNMERELPGILGRCDKIVFKLPFSVAAVKRAYNGRPGCACGCRGKYYSKDISNLEAYQLYDMTQKQHTRGIKFIYNKVKNLGAIKGIEVIDDYIFSVEYQDRVYTLYLRD